MQNILACAESLRLRFAVTQRVARVCQRQLVLVQTVAQKVVIILLHVASSNADPFLSRDALQCIVHSAVLP